MSDPLQLPYELRLGVTGHRTLPDCVGVATAVAALLDRIDRTLDRQDVAPLLRTLVSPLARGADRVVAEVVLARGGRLEVITPRPLEDYRHDFSSGADLDEFERLLQHAASVSQLPGAAHGGNPDRAAIDRDASYLKVGERVIAGCELLLAIWNGRRGRGIGGTASVVELALKDGRTVVWIHSERPADPPRIVKTLSYDDNGDLADHAMSAFPATLEDLSPGYSEHVSYCDDRALPPQAYEPQIASTREELLAAAGRAGLPPGSIDAAVAAIVPPLVRADALARHYQRRHTWTVNGVLYLAASGVTVAVIQVLFFPLDSWIVAFEVLSMAAVFALWSFGRTEKWHHKWLRDRYLAERLRIALFTTLAGLPAADPTGDESLPFYQGPQRWLRLAPSAVSRSARTDAGHPPFEPLRRFVIEAWLENQRAFHAANAVRKSQRERRGRALGLALFGFTLLMAVLHLTGGHEAETHRAALLRVDLWIIFFALVAPVWAGVVHSITSQMELERVARRSERMADVLERFAARARAARALPEFQDVCAEAAAVMAIETHEWWVLLSFQEVQLHV